MQDRTPFAVCPSTLALSVIVPTLNEAGQVEGALASVHAQAGPWEAIVADGGSTDATVARARPLATRVLAAPRGRARQMNAAAARATGDVLLFLHADTRLPPGAFAAVRRALADPGAEGGVFRLRFDRPTPLLRLYAACTRLPWHRLAFGDRAPFVRRAAFEAVGGFPDWPVFEDLELAARLHARGSLRFLPEVVTTSARRFQRVGTLRQQARNLRLWLHYLTGGDPEAVADAYRYDVC